ncbi:MAG: ImmA/IrrE family metallo-endopeptidase [Candidatus Eremiobacteraeota bacterium]|nr:ImmA/IrrE family metallo-endopeptidase [Candidatus Eremiobacteraeota bacterium]
MVNYTEGINPGILKWAREKSGYSLDKIAQKIKKKIDVIREWESGKSVPTYIQLEQLANKIYKRPIALFFFPEPPPEPDVRQKFRTLPSFKIDQLSPDTLYAIRQAKAMQIALAELNDGINPSPQKVFRDIQLDFHLDLSVETNKVRDYLGISLEKQVEWGSSRDALNQWREVIQDKGVFVFKRSFKEKGISGFCLTDKEFPVIYLNNSTTATRQIFSIFHELSHILLKINGITIPYDRYIDSLSGVSKDIEVFCNKFASEFLVPYEDFRHRIDRTFVNEDIEVFANKMAMHYKVSREVILRKLLDAGKIDRELCEYKASQWNAEYIKKTKDKQSGKGGGNYYATQATYLGEEFLTQAFNRYYQGRCTIEQLAGYLNIKEKNIPALEDFIMSRKSR